jgi:hypothetical protein
MSRCILTKNIQLYDQSAQLIGYGIDIPAADQSFDWPLITIAGWVIGKDEPIREVEVALLAENEVLQILPVNIPRPDVASFLPHVPQSENSGFYGYLSAIGLPKQFEIVISAIDFNKTVIPLANVVFESDPEDYRYRDFVRLQPIMLNALARSGTTWLARLLIAHPEVVGYPVYPYEMRAASYWLHACRVLTTPSNRVGIAHPDLFWFDLQHISRPPFYSAFNEDLLKWFNDTYVNLIALEYKFTIQSFYDYIAKKLKKKKVRYFVEKQTVPNRSWLIYDLYSKPREIFLVRDWRDVFCSIIAFNNKRGVVTFGREGMESDAAFAYRLGADIANLRREYHTRADRALLVRYEELLLNPEHELKRILDYIGVDATLSTIRAMLRQANKPDPLLQQHRTSRSERESIGRWKRDLSPELQEVVNAVFREHLEAFGYA